MFSKIIFKIWYGSPNFHGRMKMIDQKQDSNSQKKIFSMHPKMGSWQHHATNYLHIEILTFTRQSISILSAKFQRKSIFKIIAMALRNWQGRKRTVKGK